MTPVSDVIALTVKGSIKKEVTYLLRNSKTKRFTRKPSPAE
jgi:hypothetical protein